MHSYKIEGIIIGRRNFSETDRTITILTKDQGKQVFLARGVRKITSQRGPRVEIFNQIKAQIHRGKTWDILGEIETINRFEKLRGHLDRVATAYEICELADRLTPENDSCPDLFFLVSEKLNQLSSDQAIDLDQTITNFKTKLLVITGFWPENRTITPRAINGFIEDLIHAKIKSEDLRKTYGQS